MPLHGKIVVIKRSGGDGTEFPLTATCLFGRKPDCDIRIQLPQVSKEHCRIDLNENKEVILTNLSAVNPICVNGEVLKQSDRLKHGDVITIIDRSFRFEYPPVPTPKKRSSRGGKTETLKVLQDQQVVDSGIVETGDRKSAGPHLKDGTNIGNIQRSLDKTLEMESKEEGSQGQSKTSSPFNDLYQMIKKSLDVKTPRKSSVSVPQTPSSSVSFTKPTSVRKPAITEGGITPTKDGVTVFASQSVDSTPQSVKKQRRSYNIPSTDVVSPGVSENGQSAKSEATPPRKRNSSTPKKSTVSEAVEQITATPKSPGRRKSEEKKVSTEKASPKEGGTTKRKSGELGTDLPNSKNKRKRVSFGGYLSPEFFDKRLPPDSPLRKGAAPRRSLSLLKPKRSLLRRASVIGLMKGLDGDHPTLKSKTKSPKNAAPKSKAASPKASPKSKAASPKASPKSKAASPKASPKSKAASLKASPKSKAASLKASPKSKAASLKASPKSKAASPKASPKSKAASPKASPKSKAASPKASPKSKAASPKASPKSKAASPKASPKSKAASPKASPKSKAVSPKASPKSKATSPAKASTKKERTPSPKDKLPKSPKLSPASVAANKSTPVASKQHKSATPKRDASSDQRLSLVSGPGSQDINAEPETPQRITAQTPTMRGRFSVSLIGTPSPVTEMHAVATPVLSVITTPKIPLRRKSMKSTSKRTPNLSKSAIKVIQRSGVSRASMKISNCWADVVKYGKPKAQVLATKTNLPQKKKPKAASKPKMKTPARKLKGHVSTGHADSPVTIVIGRAHKRAVAHSAGAVPRVVTNIALLKKNMKMDEDLTGLTEMFKTPVTARKRKSMKIDESKATETPAGQSTAITDPSVLNTPEEPGEMMVSPLSVASSAKGSRYNSEAVQRLFDADKESGLSSDFPALNVTSDSSELILADLQSKAVTPKQKPEMPECLTGVKRLMKTPRQKGDPVADLRGKLLKTPKQKPEQPECLSGVKRLMKTPKQKSEPIEDLKGKLLKTPKQKVEQEECLTGVKRLMKTPQQEPEQLECFSELKSLSMSPSVAVDVTLNSAEEPQEQQAEEQKTPKQRRSPRECLSGVKRMIETPKVKAAPVEDMVGVKTPQQEPEQSECVSGIKSLSTSPSIAGDVTLNSTEEPQEQQAEEQKTPNPRSSPTECLTGVKRMIETPKVKAAPAEDMVGVKSLMETPQQKLEQPEFFSEIKGLYTTPLIAVDVTLNGAEDEEPQEQQAEEQKTPSLRSSPRECLTGVKRMIETPKVKAAPVEDMVGVKRLMKTPKEKGTAVKENFGIKRLMESPRLQGSAPVEDFDCLKELLAEPVEHLETPTDEELVPVDNEDVAQELQFAEEEHQPDDISNDAENEVPIESQHENVSDSVEAVPQSAIEENPCVDEPMEDNVSENLQPEEEPLVSEVAKMDAAAVKDVTENLQPEEEPLDSEVATMNAAAVEDVTENMLLEEEPLVNEIAKIDAASVADVSENLQPEEEPLVSKVATMDAAVVEDVGENLQLKEEPLVNEVAQIDAAAVESVQEKKSVRGRRAKVVEFKEETPEIPVPVRAGRGRNNAATAPTAATRGTRGRKAQVGDEVELLVEESAPSNVPPKMKRGRKAKVVSEDQMEVVKEIITEPEKTPEPEQSEQSPTVDVDVDLKPDSAAPLERGLKPKRGRKNIQPEISVTDQDEPQVVTIKDAENEVAIDSRHENVSDSVETVPQSTAEEDPCVEEPIEEVAKIDAAAVESVQEKKSVRGRRGKVVESKEETPEIPVPVRARRGRNNEATAPTAATRGTRGRKAQVGDEVELLVEESAPSSNVPPKMKRGRKAKVVSEDQMEVVKEIITEPEKSPVPEQSEQSLTVEVDVEIETDSAAPVESGLKPKRGRKNIQPEISVTDQVVTVKDATEDLIQQTPIDSAPVKGRRGRKPEAAAKRNTRGRNAKCEEGPAESQTGTGTSPDTEDVIQENEPQLEEAVIKPQRGRKAKQAVVKAETVAGDQQQEEEAKVEQAAEKPRRGRKARNDPEAEDAVVASTQPQASVRGKRGRNAKLEEEEKTMADNSEDLVSQEPAKKTRVETPPPDEETTLPAVAKSRRGGRKANQEPESLAIIESNVQEVVVVEIVNEKPKRGRKPKQMSKEVIDEPEPEIKGKTDDQPPVLEIIQQKKTRGTKTSEKIESAQVTPAKRARQATTVPAEISSEKQQPKRGRRAAVKPIIDDSAASTETRSSEDSSKSNGKAKQSTRCVQWRSDVQVFEIPTVTPVKATRGRKPKVDIESKCASKETNSTEEENLSEEIIEAQPAKRARRGAKVQVVPENEETTSKQEQELQPKTRRGRPAKK